MLRLNRRWQKTLRIAEESNVVRWENWHYWKVFETGFLKNITVKPINGDQVFLAEEEEELVKLWADFEWK